MSEQFCIGKKYVASSLAPGERVFYKKTNVEWGSGMWTISIDGATMCDDPIAAAQMVRDDVGADAAVEVLEVQYLAREVSKDHQAQYLIDEANAKIEEIRQTLLTNLAKIQA